VKLAPVHLGRCIPLQVLEDGFRSKAGLLLQDQKEIGFLLSGEDGGNRRTILDRGPTGARWERHGVDRCGAFAAGEDMGGTIG